MWSHFDKGQYFSRTLGEVGGMAKIKGSSDWRLAVLPFQAEEGMVPEKLVLNLHLTGGGNIEFRDLALYEFEAPGYKKPSALPFFVGALVLAAIIGFLAIRIYQKRKAAQELRVITASEL